VAKTGNNSDNSLGGDFRRCATEACNSCNCGPTEELTGLPSSPQATVQGVRGTETTGYRLFCTERLIRGAARVSSERRR
jgi:hypothetical protein